MTEVTPSSMDNTTGERIQRRTILQGAAWAIPVLAVAIATPGAAASGQPVVDLVVSVTGILEGAANQNYNGTGEPSYPDANLYHSYVTWTNNGPDAVPAGSMLTVSNSTSRVFQTPSVSRYEPSATALGINSTTLVSLGSTTSASFVNTRSYVLNVALPAGASFSIQFQHNAVDVTPGGYGSYIAATITPPAGVTESNSSNNLARTGNFWITGS